MSIVAGEAKLEGGALTEYTYCHNDEILTAGADSFTFDHFGNMKTKVSGGNTTTYSWDFESNLIGIDNPGTSNDDSHEYDGAGRRMRSKFNGAANWTNYVWDESNETLLAEYTLISSTYLIKSENTWGLGLISTNREGTKRYFHFDGDGNTIALTNTSETVTDTYGYSTGGVPVASEDSGSRVNPFRWMGQVGAYDDGAMGSAADLVFFRTRLVYATTLGLAINGRAPSPGLPCYKPCMDACLWEFPGKRGYCYDFCVDFCILWGKGKVQACKWLYSACHQFKEKSQIERCLGIYIQMCWGI